MITTTVILALKSVLGLMLIWVFVFYFWKDYCLDTFREDVFTIRDDLFLYAADGNVSFDDPAYTLLRGRLNLSLRYAHELTLARFVLALRILSRVPNPETAALEQALKSLPPDVAIALTQFRSRFVDAFIKYVTLRSFFLYLVVIFVQVFGGFKQTIRRYVFPKVEQGIESLESEAKEEEESNRTGPVPVGIA